MTARKTQVRQIAWVSVGVLILDQVSKAIIRVSVEPGTPPREDVFFQFVHLGNPGLVGGAFSAFPSLSFILAVAALAVLVYLFRHLDPVSRWQSVAYGMVLGGAISNDIDRLVFHAVTDFLQFNFIFIPFDFPWKNYPAFNLADSAIVIGVGVLVLTWNVGARKHAASTV